ncbi:fatty-acid amide hydrolase 2-like isoform X1 [Onthophagus taurus]|uniref:fatty-acid amide hydrolase 2-like isoform X1 n=1 Tax=Onthophagus taurus TaxID=166361 RepID=UPI0039BDE8F4
MMDINFDPYIWAKWHSFAIRTGGLLAVASSKVAFPVFWILSWRKTQKIPPIDHDIFRISAKKLSLMIRNKEISCEEVITRYINRIIEVNKVLNAVVDERFQEALEEARIIDEWLNTNALNVEEIEKRFPLLGIPVTVKEACKVKGMIFSVGIRTREGMIADSDGEAVRRLRSSGAIPLLVSNTPETCFGMECDNLISGVCSNPYNTNYTCGGSSGGEGALLGAGCSLIGLGSDVGGSIRIPSLFNGIFGHKPTSALVPIQGHHPLVEDEKFSRYLVLGPMARYAEDLRLMLSILAKEDINVSEKVKMTDITVFYLEDMNVNFVNPVDKCIRKALLKCVEHLGGRCQAKISDTKFLELSETLDLSVMCFGDVGNKPDLLVDQNDPSIRYNFFSEVFKFFLNKSKLNYNSLLYNIFHTIQELLFTQNTTYFQQKVDEFKTKFTNALGDNGVFLYPTLHTSAFQHKATMFNVTGLAYTMAFNIFGFPSTHVPLGLNEKGLPIGIQVVANPNRDAVCLSVAEELERRFGGWIPPPS